MTYTLKNGSIALNGVPMLALVRARWGNDPDVPTQAALDDLRAKIVPALNAAEATGDMKPNVHMTADESEFIRRVLIDNESTFNNADLATMQHILDELDHAHPDQIGMHEAPPTGYTTRMVTFIGQAWINGHAVEVDESRFIYAVTEAEYNAAGGDGADEYDQLAQAAEAPAIVREWSGPFEVEPEHVPVAVTLDKGGEVTVLARFASIKEAEEFLATSATIDPDDLAAGHYGIDAPEEMVNP